MSFTNQRPWTVTVEDVKRPWGGKRDGSRFACGICLKRFQPGDTARWICQRGGNFFVCLGCDGETASERYNEIMEAFRARCVVVGAEW